MQHPSREVIRVDKPCTVSWDGMRPVGGDGRVRFCSECGHHVYNLSAMDVEEAAERIAQNDDRLCVRFYRRSDGTILTQDCPAGVEDARLRRRRAAVKVAVVEALRSLRRTR